MTLGAVGLTVIGASAGSGKTTRLTKEVERAIVSDGELSIRLEGLVAVTYTRRAHVELESRIRRALLASTAPERAARLPLAHVGTVHSVCLRWVRDMAIDMGLSPWLRVLADDEHALLQVLEGAVPLAVREELGVLAGRLEVELDRRTDRIDWAAPIRDIIDLARHGRIPIDTLASMANRSAAGLLGLLPPPHADGAPYEVALSRELREAVRRLESGADTTQDTKAALDRLRDLARRSGDSLGWGEWAFLAGLKTGAKSREAVRALRAIATEYDRHPRFRADLRRFIELVFEAAATTLDEYERWKKERGLLDYVDMIDRALRVLERGAVADDFAEQLELVVVDEMQDSSPVQLALFLRLFQLAGRASWVGDPKQCIFEYAGADPALMDAVLRWTTRAGGNVEQLGDNWRSRSELVDLTSELFACAFASHGMPREEVVATAKREVKSELSQLPALGLFYFETTTNEGDGAAIAAGVARLLRDATATPIVDPETDVARPVRAGDVAILVATNLEAERIATLLGAAGVRATLARTGLMATPEGTALAAALAYLLDPEDTLSVAQLEALHGFEGGGPDAWLTRSLEARLGDPAAPAQERMPAWRLRLERLRPSVPLLAPTEVVDAALVALDLSALASRWPDAPQRLANLDGLRKFARIYEQRCLENGEGASLSGLRRFLVRLTRAVYRRGEERAADEQYAGSDPGAVTVMTYHKSKGLEWPVVILGSLDRAPRRTAFAVASETDVGELDPDEPLRGRWIRYWPRVFGTRNARLVDAVAASDTGQRVSERERRERARLLYVGFTRARDHLILAARIKKKRPQVDWLDELEAPNGDHAIALPAIDDPAPMTIIQRPGTEPLKTRPRLWVITLGETQREPDSHAPRWFSREQPEERPGYRVSPSASSESGVVVPALRTVSVHTIHPPLIKRSASTVEWNTVGDCLHAFLASDADGLPSEARSTRALRLLEAYGVGGIYSQEVLIGAADAFRRYVDTHAPGARWRREIPVVAKLVTEHGERVIDGRIDLLLEIESRLIVVDHKSFPGVGEHVWRKKASEFAPQLGAYVLALEIASAKPVAECWIHFAVGGGVVRATPSPDRAARGR